jgi:DNA topoisomerase-1
MDTIQTRGYVWKKGSALVPSWTAFAVVALLERHFSQLVDYGFTAAMEEDLDEIARGEEEAVPWLSRFYFGNGQTGLRSMVSDNLGDIDAREVNSIPVGGSDTGIVVRVGRYGPYIQREDERAPVPEDLAPDELTVERANELLEAGSTDRLLGSHPDSGLPVVVRAGRFGPYVQVGSADDAGNGAKPATASLLGSMDPASVTLDDAMKVLSLPRILGVDPASGEEIAATNGRYGPYLRRGSDSRSLDNEDRLFSVSLDEALELFSQPRQRRGQRSTAPLRELGPDPTTGAPMTLRDGRFGPYVTDGVTNASLRKDDTVDALTPERAAELLADRRAAGPAKRVAKRASAAKKPGSPEKSGPKKAGAAKKSALRKSSSARKRTG